MTLLKYAVVGTLSAAAALAGRKIVVQHLEKRAKIRELMKELKSDNPELSDDAVSKAAKEIYKATGEKPNVVTRIRTFLETLPSKLEKKVDEEVERQVNAAVAAKVTVTRTDDKCKGKKKPKSKK